MLKADVLPHANHLIATPDMTSRLLLSITLCLPLLSAETKQQAMKPFSERLAIAREEQAQKFAGSTSDMVEGTQAIIDQFFPAAVAKISREQGISLAKAEALLRKNMRVAAHKTHDDYIREYGSYGTVVRVLAEENALHVVISVLEEKE